MQKVRAKSRVKARNWPAYVLYRKDEEMLFLERAKQVVWGMDAPYEPNGGEGTGPHH
jgi:hypothetical protein